MSAKSVVQARLTDKEQKTLDGLSARLGWSRSRVIREGLRLVLAANPTPHRPRIIGLGKFSSGIPDLGSNKKHLEGYGR